MDAGQRAPSPPGDAAAVPLPPGVRVVPDLQFADTEQEPLLLDLYLPEQRGDDRLPLVVFIFGGAWRSGSRIQIGWLGGQQLAARGYAVASVSYRLSSVAYFPAQIHDVKTALHWLRAHADDYGLDPGRVAAWGPSAGGHLAALLGASPGVAELEPAHPDDTPPVDSRVQAVVDFFGPTDFLQMDDHQLGERIRHDDAGSPESRLIGGPIQENAEATARANPISYVTGDEPPFLIVHGRLDPLVPHHQSVLLNDALLAAGVDSTLHTIEDGGHGVGGEFGSQALLDRVTAFLDHHLGRPPRGEAAE